MNKIQHHPNIKLDLRQGFMRRTMNFIVAKIYKKHDLG
jgi:hypothetical protein